MTKKLLVPVLKCPFRVLVDSREQIPFTFSEMRIPIKGKMQDVFIETVETCLGNNGGDYMVEGIDDVRIERKSLEDLYSTLANRDAFREQIEWMNFAFRFSAVVIEASWAEVCDPSKMRTPLDWEVRDDGAIVSSNYGIEYDGLGTFTAIAYGDGEILYQGPLVTAAIEVCETMPDETWRSKLHPHSVVATIASWQVRFPRVHWLAPGGRREAEVATFDLLRQSYRHSVESTK